MDDPTLLILWLLSCLAVAIMVTRLVLRKVRGQDFTIGDYLTMGAILCALVRLPLIHVVITWGTNNMSPTVREKTQWTAEKIYRREIGSKFAVANRVFYNSYLWLQKLVLLDITRQLIKGLHWEYIVLRSFYVVLAGTYIAVQVVTFSECNPFHLYWQVLPYPGTCSRVQLHLWNLELHLRRHNSNACELTKQRHLLASTNPTRHARNPQYPYRYHADGPPNPHLFLLLEATPSAAHTHRLALLPRLLHRHHHRHPPPAEPQPSRQPSQPNDMGKHRAFRRRLGRQRPGAIYPEKEKCARPAAGAGDSHRAQRRAGERLANGAGESGAFRPDESRHCHGPGHTKTKTLIMTTERLENRRKGLGVDLDMMLSCSEHRVSALPAVQDDTTALFSFYLVIPNVSHTIRAVADVLVAANDQP